jgi:hypothetical protein
VGLLGGIPSFWLERQCTRISEMGALGASAATLCLPFFYLFNDRIARDFTQDVPLRFAAVTAPCRKSCGKGKSRLEAVLEDWLHRGGHRRAHRRNHRRLGRHEFTHGDVPPLPLCRGHWRLVGSLWVPRGTTFGGFRGLVTPHAAISALIGGIIGVAVVKSCITTENCRRRKPGGWIWRFSTM